MTPPIPPTAERTLQVAGARRPEPGGPPRPVEVVPRLRALNADGGAFVALFDGRAIGGERHLLSAWAHLGRSRAPGESRLRDRSAEFALYVAGDDQLPRALRKVGVSADTEAFVVVVERPRSLESALVGLGLVPDPTAYPRPIGSDTLERLGIAAEERSAVPESGWEGLILERVAFVDLMAPHGGPPSTSKRP